VIVVEVQGDAPSAVEALRRIDVVDEVSRQDQTITIGTSDSASAVSAVVMALSRTDLEVRSLTVRTPTLDDVFRQLTGSPIDVAGTGS
jgi:ABC-2 type transport system ATP-binding protein